MIAGSRKYTLALIYLLVSVGLVLAGKADGSAWLQQTTIVLLAYMGGNSAEHWAKRGANETTKREG